MKRIVVYVYENEKGVVADYAAFCARALLIDADEVYVVLNGKILDNEIQKFYQDGIKTIFLGKKVSNIKAYKEAISNITFEKLKGYDELVLMDSSVYGPIYPISDLLNEMKYREVDFYGITKTKSKNSKQENLDPYFIAFKKDVLISPYFKEFFEKKQKRSILINKNIESYFKSKGFKEGAYVHSSIFETGIFEPFKFYPDILLEKYKVPFIDKNIFSAKYYISEKQNFGIRPLNTFNYIKEKTSYGINLILEDITRNFSMNEIKKNLHLNFTLSDSHREVFLLNKHALLTDSPELLEDSIKELSSIFDIFCLGDKKAKFKAQYLSDKTSYFKQIKDLSDTYDYFYIFMPDKNFLKSLDNQTKEAYIKHLLDCSFYNRIYISNITDIFMKHPYIGLLAPSPFMFDDFKIYKRQITKKEVANFLEKMEIDVKVDENFLSTIPAAFWLRKETLDYINDVVDFECDYNLNKGIIFSLLAQKYGYLTGTISNKETALLYTDNLEYAFLKNKNILTRPIFEFNFKK